MTTPLTKLIAENKERPIADAPRDGTDVILIRQSDPPIVAGYFHNEWQNFDTVDEIIGEPTHFRPLPDDRLALVAELYDQFITQLANADAAKTILDWPALAQNIRKKAAAIAEGRDNAASI